jgi:hypothetical protein
MKRKWGVFRTGKASHSATIDTTISAALFNLSTWLKHLKIPAINFDRRPVRFTTSTGQL